MSWNRVWGHDVQVQAFARVVRQGRLAHAYLFTGPAGIGKRLFAVELAKTLLCENRAAERFEACDRCSACLLVDAGNHPDLHIAGRPEDKLEVPIDTMRELSRCFSLKSARGHGKIALVDDADDLNEESANCFLKTLEEPPPGSVLILIGTSADRQLATIRSRCQTVPFTPLAPELVAKLLQAEGVEDPILLERLVRLSDGSPGQARDLADPELWKFRKKFLSGLTRKPVDSVGLSRSWHEFVEETGKEAAVQRRRAARVLKLLIAFFSDALAISQGGAPHAAEEDELPALQDFANQVDADDLMALLERCLEADEHLDRRVQLVLVIEALSDALGQKLRAH
ncbi:MAG: DNA polymerase III subunit delta' [Gemmataceae bacterium]